MEGKERIVLLALSQDEVAVLRQALEQQATSRGYDHLQSKARDLLTKLPTVPEPAPERSG